MILRFTKMATRTKAAVVGLAYMQLKEKWTVYKCVKSVLVTNTALFMMWTEDDAKQHPDTLFKGNVRIASLKGVAAGVYVFVFKDNVGRKVRAQDMDKVVGVSNNILASRQGVHQAAKAAAMNEPLCDELEYTTTTSDDDENEDDEEKAEDEDADEDDEEEAGTALAGGPLSNDPPSDDRLIKHGTSSAQIENLSSDTAQREDDCANEIPGTVHEPPVTTTPLASQTDAGVAGSPGMHTEQGEGQNVEEKSGTADGPTTTIFGNNTVDPPPPPGTVEQMAVTSLPETLRELREMELQVKDKKKMLRSLKKRALDPDDKRAQRKLLEGQLKAIKEEVKQEKAKAKIDKPLHATTKRARMNPDDQEPEGESEDFGLFARTERKPLNTIDKWQKGHRRAALLAAENKVVEAVTCSTWAEAYANMYEHGWAVVDNFADLMHPACQPDVEQRDYVLDCTLHRFLATCMLLLPYVNVRFLSFFGSAS